MLFIVSKYPYSYKHSLIYSGIKGYDVSNLLSNVRKNDREGDIEINRDRE